MTRYALDTNLFIDADRDPSQARALRAFYEAHLASTYLHAVVAMELLAGGVTRATARRLRDQYVEPFLARSRVVTPTFASFARAGEVIGRLVERGTRTAGGVPRSLANDVLLAAGCREHGLTLVTRNVAGFERIRTVLDFDFVPPWPAV